MNQPIEGVPMSVEDVDRELLMQSRLEALMRVWHIDDGASFSIDWDQCSDRPWSIRQSWCDGSHDGAEDTAERITGSEAWEEFHGATLAHAVEAAWIHHNSPLICQACGGDGQTERWFKPGERFTADDDERVQTHHDGSTRITRTCVPCNGEGMFVGGDS